MNQYNKKHYLLILTGLVVITMLICYTLSGGFFKPTEVFLYSGSPKQISTRITSTSSGASFRSTSSMMERSEWVSAIQFPQASTYSSSSNAMRIYASSSGRIQSFGANPISNSYTMATHTHRVIQTHLLPLPCCLLHPRQVVMHPLYRQHSPTMLLLPLRAEKLCNRFVPNRMLSHLSLKVANKARNPQWVSHG